MGVARRLVLGEYGVTVLPFLKRRLRLTTKKTIMAESSASPPTTPPAMAPAFTDVLLESSLLVPAPSFNDVPFVCLLKIAC